MLGLMQYQPLNIATLIEHAARCHADGEIVSRRFEGDIHRYTYAELAGRARQVAGALDALQLERGKRVATLAFNGYRHLELYFGISSSGRVLHTLNPRLHPEQLAWIVNHAEDSVLCFDLAFLPLIQAVHARCPTVTHWVALCDGERLPKDSGIPNLLAYEDWIAPNPSSYDWPVLDENSAASLCYTSGTTGNPKGVLYSHRSTMLHAFAAAMPDAINFSARDSVLPVVPMFHVNAWGVPYIAAMTGAKLVLPGAAMDGKSIYELIESEGVTLALGVPTVWQMMLGHMQARGLAFSTLNRTVVGGSACPPAMIQAFQQTYGVDVLHAWGMTELSPLGTVCSLKNKHLAESADAQLQRRRSQGRPVFGVELRLKDAEGQILPWDGKQTGELQARGHWVVSEYFKGDDSAVLEDGWFPTGDVSRIDADGFMLITDRSKDVIKSGGEWISSIDVENIAMAHPAVAMAACVGMRHPKWDERPVVIVALKPEQQLSREELLAFYEGKTAKWQIPDDVLFVPAIPLGATGKMLKTKLREQFKDFQFPDLAA